MDSWRVPRSGDHCTKISLPGSQDRLQVGVQWLAQASGERNKTGPTSQLGTGLAEPKAHDTSRS